MSALLAGAGQIAAIVICLFAFLFVVITVGIHLAMSFITSWLNEKVELIKMFRPYVESVNTSTSAAERGIAPAQSEQPAARIAAQIPLRVNAADKKVGQVADSVVSKVIEVRARSLQVKQVAKAFFLPGLTHRAAEPAATLDAGMQFASPGYQALMNERPEVVPGPEQESVRRRIPEVPQEQIMHSQG